MGGSAARTDLKSMKKNDLILAAALIAAAFVMFGGVSLYSRFTTREPEAVVYLDGKEWGRYVLSEDTQAEIRQEGERYNILRIRDGKADITQASCPDKICVDHRPVSRRGESLVCLPNRVTVEIENGKEPEVDAAVK